MSFFAATAAVAALAWVYLLAGHGGYWRTDQRLPSRPGRPRTWPSVVAVIPARDEAAILPATLPTLFAQDYPGSFRAVLVDDRSHDATAVVAAALAKSRPLRVLAGKPRPPGWAGKVWAMEQGIATADPSEYVLFTDADIAYQPGTLTALVDAAEAGRYDLVSQMALLRTRTHWERLLVPAFVYFFAQLYPFRRVNRAGGRTAAAAGGCMLVRRQALRDAGGLKQIRGALIDDVALGRLLKRRPGKWRGKCWLGFGTGVYSRRPYPRLADLWGMVTRSAYDQLRYSPALLACTIAGLVWIYIVPPAAVVAGGLTIAAGGAAVWCAAAGLAGWAVMTLTYLPMLRLYGLSALRAPALPLIAAIYTAMTLDSARRHWIGRGGAWKGRKVGVGAASVQTHKDP